MGGANADRYTDGRSNYAATEAGGAGSKHPERVQPGFDARGTRGVRVGGTDRHGGPAGGATGRIVGLVVPYRTLWADTERAEEKTELGDQFGEILLKAYREEAYVDPKAFLSGLSEGELETVQHVHWLADPIKVGSLTEEGALNLLMPPAAQVDLNHDSFTQSGAAYGFRFPDSTAPPEVVAAWDEATADLSPSDRMMYEFQMKLPVLIGEHRLASRRHVLASTRARRPRLSESDGVRDVLLRRRRAESHRLPGGLQERHRSGTIRERHVVLVRIPPDTGGAGGGVIGLRVRCAVPGGVWFSLANRLARYEWEEPPYREAALQTSSTTVTRPTTS